jgi:hypothetical protein
VHWAEFALGPVAQCAWPTPAASARPTRTAHAWPAATWVHGHTGVACARWGGPGQRSARGGSAPAHERRRGRLTSAETATSDGVRLWSVQRGFGPRRSSGASCRDDGGTREAAVGRRGRGGWDAARGARRRSARSAGLGGVECGRCPDNALNRAGV